MISDGNPHADPMKKTSVSIHQSGVVPEPCKLINCRRHMEIMKTGLRKTPFRGKLGQPQGPRNRPIKRGRPIKPIKAKHSSWVISDILLLGNSGVMRTQAEDRGYEC